MQTEAEKYLIFLLKKILFNKGGEVKMINLGAAKSTVVEDSLLSSKKKFICDRCDIDDSQVDAVYVTNSYICPLEDMSDISDKTYTVAFANFVMEHIESTSTAAIEMARIIKPGGDIVLSLSNPKAPEFRLAKITPTRFHQLFRKKDNDSAYPVNYNYKSIDNFIVIMERSGWKLKEKKYFPAVYSYLERFPLLRQLSWLYDKFVAALNIKNLQGHVVLHFERV